ncbi:hypothetical protein ES703_112520 [subsurface metagenome]
MRREVEVDMAFCTICRHKVQNVEKHKQTPEHQRNLGQVNRRGPRLTAVRRRAATSSNY